jgi:hypothetical protein
MATLKVPSTACRVVSSPCHTIATPCPNHQQEAFLSGRKTRRSSPNQRKFTHPLVRPQLLHAEDVVVAVLRAVAADEGQIAGEEVAGVELAHKQMARDQATRQ